MFYVLGEMWKAFIHEHKWKYDNGFHKTRTCEICDETQHYCKYHGKYEK